MKRMFEAFKFLYEGFRAQYQDFPEDVAISDDVQSYIDGLSVTAEMAVEDGLSVDDAHYVRNCMETLKLVLNKDMYNQYVPESLLRDLDAIIGDSKIEANKVQGLDFPLYLNLGLER